MMFGKMWRVMMREIGGSHGAGGLDEFFFADGQDLGADQARVAHPAGNREGENQVGHAGAEEGDQRNGDENSGERHECVHDQDVQERVEPAAIISSNGAEDHAEEQCNGDNGGGDEKRDAGAVNDAGEDVAAQFIGAKPVGGGRGLQASMEMDRGGVEGCDPGCEDGQRDKNC